MLTIELREDVDGYNRVSNTMRHLIRVLDVDMDRVANDFSDEEAKRLAGKPYPPQPLKSRYIRTGTLAGSWRGERGTRKGAFAIVNDAADQTRGGRLYPNFVVGEQTAVMAGIGWWRMEDEMDGIRSRFREVIIEEINQAMAMGPI